MLMKLLTKKLLPNAVISTIYNNLGRMTVNISSFVTHTNSNSKSNEDAFTVFYSVRSVLYNAKKYSEFFHYVENDNSGMMSNMRYTGLI